MKTRKITLDGDYQLGRGNAAFYQDAAEGVAQSVVTRLALWQGTWFLDTSEGTPWLEKILGKSKAAEIVIKDRILRTKGVDTITDIATAYEPTERRLLVQATISTPYGETTVKKAIDG